jgi:hypothetical protein
MQVGNDVRRAAADFLRALGESARGEQGGRDSGPRAPSDSHSRHSLQPTRCSSIVRGCLNATIHAQEKQHR